MGEASPERKALAVSTRDPPQGATYDRVHHGPRRSELPPHGDEGERAEIGDAERAIDGPDPRVEIGAERVELARPRACADAAFRAVAASPVFAPR